MISGQSCFGLCSGRRSTLAGCVAVLTFLIISVAFPSLLAGCGGNRAVIDYTTRANQVLDEINAKAGELKKLWTVPFADQVGLQEALATYRKALANGQEMVDSTDPPGPCVKLDELLRQTVDRGLELANVTSPFADYTDSVGPIAARISEVVASLATLQKDRDIPSGLAGLTEKARKADTDLRSVVPPLLFQGIHQEILKFSDEIVKAFEKASKELGTDSGRFQETQPQYGEEQGTEPGDRQLESQSKQVQPLLEDIPDEWRSFNEELSMLMNVARQVAGLEAKNAETENIVGQVVAEIAKLKQQYK
jgi:hypothetical protein